MRFPMCSLRRLQLIPTIALLLLGSAHFVSRTVANSIASSGSSSSVPVPSLLPSPTPARDPTPSAARQSSQGLPDGRYEYVFQDGLVSIYEIGGTFSLINSFTIPTSDGTRGAAACTNGMLWISHGSDQTGKGAGKLLEYDLLTGKIIYDVSYAHGIDSHVVTNDCSTIYMPDGELSNTGLWHVVNASTGRDVGEISGPSYPHNTVLNDSGTHLYMGGRRSLPIPATTPFTCPFPLLREECGRSE